MGKNGVKVIIRTRPTAQFATNQILIDQDENTVTVHASNLGSPSKSESSNSLSTAVAPSNASSIASVAAAAPSNRKDCWKFKFHQVLHNAGQDKVYEAIARDIVHGAVVNGVNGTILAYGQTGAGKSFTMIGDTRNYQHRGIAPRAIAQLYEEAENRIEIAYSIKVSYMEIYNDRIYDLLEHNPSHNLDESAAGPHKGDFVVVEDTKGTYVRGLAQVEVQSEQEALDQLFHGELQRTVAEHQLNKRSNRSHCIFTFHIAQKSRAGGNERVVHSKLHLVDLAGSERLKKTHMDGDSSSTSIIKKESMYINQSLSFLEQCIVALSSKDPRHIPYRQTKLTNVLKDSLGGNSNTLMFACIWGESKHLEETISTLKLAQRMMRVQNEVATIVETDPAILLRKYEKQIKELKHELVMHDALVERAGIVYDEHTPEQKHQLLKMIRQFVDAPTVEKEDEVLKLTSMHEIRELFRQFKLLLKNAESEAEMGGGGGTHASNGSIRSGSADPSASRSQTSNGSRSDIHHGGSNNEGHGSSHDEFVGDDDEPGTIGFGLGIVPSAARPSTMDTVKKAKDAKQGNGQPDGSGDQRSRHRSPSPTRSAVGFSLDERGGGPAGDGNGGSTRLLLTDSDGDDTRDSHAARVKNEAFQFYKSGPGKKLQKNMHEEKDKLFDVKQKVKQISTRLNTVKLQIDKVKGQLEEKRSHRGGNTSPTSAKKSAAAAGGSISKDRNAYCDDQVVVDEEEFILMTAEREAKREYRSLFDDLKDAKSELAFMTRSVELLRMRMVREFEEWYEEEEQSSSLRSKAKDDDDSGGYFARGTRSFAGGSKDDKLDDGEKFDQMEVDRIRAQDPDSLAFFQAQKKMRQQQAASGSSGDAKATRKPKRG
uniref:Kinesin-like protein n=1 Tax=Globisporangium ultimum (strain ATCC 200006 / CBS 805.95 / DAOM BR144) TaxID=431595 RepID=K3WBJ2_GLOUD